MTESSVGGCLEEVKQDIQYYFTWSLHLLYTALYLFSLFSLNGAGNLTTGSPNHKSLKEEGRGRKAWASCLDPFS